jgi:hypothetical protein
MTMLLNVLVPEHAVRLASRVKAVFASAAPVTELEA